MGEYSKPQQKKTPSDTGRRQLLAPKKGLESQKQVKTASARHQQRTGVPENKPQDGPVVALDPVAASRQRHQARLSKGASPKAVPILAKLEVGGVHDPLEAEADQVADFVTRNKAPQPMGGTDTPSAIVQRAPKPVDSVAKAGVETPIRRKSNKGKAADTAPGQGFEAQLKATKGRGKGLDKATRGNLESKLDTSLGHVQVHQDSEADSLSSEIGAKAFAHGNDIYFRKGHYQPHTPAGQHLIAHEVWHTLQGNGKVMRKAGGGAEGEKKKTFQIAENHLAQITGIHLAEGNRKSHMKGLLDQLYLLTNEEISEFWQENDHALKIEKFADKLTPAHYATHPREIVISFQAIPASRRMEMMNARIAKREKKSKEEKRELKEKHALQALFLGQGIGAFGKDRTLSDEGIKILTKAAKSYADEIADLKADIKQYHLFEMPTKEVFSRDGIVENPTGLSFYARRKAINGLIERTVDEILLIHPKWGKTGAMTPITPKQATRIYRIIRGMPDEARSEFIKRYQDDFDNLMLNLPSELHSALDFGIDRSRGASAGTEAFIVGELDKAENWNNTDILRNRMEMLLDMALLVGPNRHIADAIIRQTADVKSWDSHAIYDRCREIILIAYSKDVEANDDSTESIAILEAILAAFKEAAPSGPSATAVNDHKPMKETVFRKDYSMPNAVAGFGRAWMNSKIAESKIARIFHRIKTGEQLPAPEKRTSPFDELLLFAIGNDNDPGLKLRNLSLADLQYHLGGDLMGIAVATENQPPLAGTLNADIGSDHAYVDSGLIPLEYIAYELGDGIFKSGPTTLQGFEAIFEWDAVQAKTKKEKKGQAAPLPTKSKISINLLDMQKMLNVSSESLLGIGLLHVENLVVISNQPLYLGGPVSGFFGLNIMFAVMNYITNILMLVIDAIMTALDPLLPNLDLFMGQDVSELLLAGFDSHPAIEISIGAVKVQNILGQDSEMVREVKIEETELYLGGNMIEHFEKKLIALADQTPEGPNRDRLKRHYESIIENEKIRMAKHEDAIRVLEAQYRTNPDPERLETIAMEKRKGRLMLAMTLNNASVSMAGSGDVDEPLPLPYGGIGLNLDLKAHYRTNHSQGPLETFAMEMRKSRLKRAMTLNNASVSTVGSGYGVPLPIPSGGIGVALDLNAPAIGQSELEREEMRLKAALGALEGKDMVPASSLNGDRIYAEALGLGVSPQVNAELEKMLGFNVDQLIPGWLVGEFNITSGITWRLKVTAADLALTKLPEAGDYFVKQIRPNEPSEFFLKQPEITLAIGLNSMEDQKKNGIIPRVITIEELYAKELSGNNARIQTYDREAYLKAIDTAHTFGKSSLPAELDAGKVFDLDFSLAEKSSLHDVSFKGLRMVFNPDASDFEIDASNIGVTAGQIDLKKAFGTYRIGDIETIGLFIPDYVADGFSMGLSTRYIDKADQIEEISTIAYEKGKGEPIELAYRLSELGITPSRLSITQTILSTRKPFGRGEISDPGFTRDRYSRQETKYEFDFAVDEFTIPRLSFDLPSQDTSFGLHGTKNEFTPPLEMHGIVGKGWVTFVQEEGKDESGHFVSFEKAPVMMTEAYIEKFGIQSIDTNDIKINFGEQEIKMEGNTNLTGLYVLDVMVNVDEKGLYDIDLLGAVGYQSAHIQELIYDMMHFKGFSSGRAFVNRVYKENDKNEMVPIPQYAFGIADVGGEFDWQAIIDKKEITKLGALFGPDFTITGDYFVDERTILATASTKSPITIDQLDWKTSDGKMHLLLHDGGQALASDLTAQLKVTLGKKGGKHLIEKIEVVDMRIGCMTASNIRIKYDHWLVETQENETVTLTNISARNTSYDLVNSVLVAHVKADNLHGSLDAKLTKATPVPHPVKGGPKETVDGHFLIHPTLDFQMLDFDLEADGTTSFGFESGGMSLPAFDPEFQSSWSPSPPLVKGIDPNRQKNFDTDKSSKTSFGQLDDVFRLFQAGKTKITRRKIFQESPWESWNTETVVAMENPSLNNLTLHTHKDAEYLESTPLDATLGLSGKVDGTLYIVDREGSILISTKVPGEDGEFLNGGKLSIAYANLFLEDIAGVMPDQKGKPEAQYDEKGYLLTPDTPYEFSDKFDILDSAIDTKDGGGFLFVSIFGKAGKIDIGSFSTQLGDTKHGYLNIDQLEAFLSEAIAGYLAKEARNLGGGLLGKVADRLVGALDAGNTFVEITRDGENCIVDLRFLGEIISGLTVGYVRRLLDSKIPILAKDLGPYGFYENDEAKWLSISHLVDYQVFNASLPSKEPDTTPIFDQVRNLVATLTGLASDDPCIVSLKSMRFDLAKTKRVLPANAAPGTTTPLNRISDFFKADQGDELRFNLDFGTRPTASIGPGLNISDLHSGGIERSAALSLSSFVHAKFSTSEVNIKKLYVGNQYLGTSQLKADLYGLDLHEFSLELAKKKQ